MGTTHTPERFLRTLQAKIDKGDLKQALTQCNRALQRPTLRMLALERKAQILVLRRRFKEARRIFAHLEQLEPGRCTLDLAELHLIRWEWESAALLLDRWHFQHGSTPRSYLLRLRAHLGLKEYDYARAALLRAEEDLRRADRRYWSQLALIAGDYCLFLERRRETRRLYSIASLLSPKNELALSKLLNLNPPVQPGDRLYSIVFTLDEIRATYHENFCSCSVVGPSRDLALNFLNEILDNAGLQFGHLLFGGAKETRSDQSRRGLEKLFVANAADQAMGALRAALPCLPQVLFVPDPVPH